MSEEKAIYKNTLVHVNERFLPQVQSQIEGNGINMDDYQKSCVLNAIASINDTLKTSGVSWEDPQLDKSNMTQTLLNVAALKLNAAANPREVYFLVRKTRQKDGKYEKKIELGIEGDGNDAILSNFGRNVEEVRQHWLVRENDEFHYPSFNGLDMEPPRWTPTGKGKVVRVVYPIIKKGTDKSVVEFYISEREDVMKNLLAHINNNLMWEDFGIPKNPKSKTTAEKEKIREKKNEILERAQNAGLDAALDDEEVNKYVSPAWKSPQSRESMLIRKMRNNIVKKIPKDFGSSLGELSFSDATNEYKEQTRKEVNEYANQDFIDIESPSTTESEKEIDMESGSETESDSKAEVIDYEDVKGDQAAEEKPKEQDKPKEETGPDF